jgi:hypothetical protein
MPEPADQEHEEEDPTRLDGPGDDEEIYESRYDECDDLRPICQGDVFTDVCLPGFDGDHELVMLAVHPCSLREGAHLRARLQAVPVRPYKQRVAPAKWPTSHKKVFPLPDLEGKKHLAAILSEAGVLKPQQITPANRIMTLAPRAILLLQQRIVWTAAHTVVKLDTLDEFNAPALAELELLEYWNEQLCGELTGQERVEALRRTAEEFEEYVKSTGLQDALAKPDRRADARSQIRMEAVRRSKEIADT